MEEIDILITDQDKTQADSPMITIIEEREPTKAHETKQESIVPPPAWCSAKPSTLPRVGGCSGIGLIPLSPIIADDSQDSIVVQVGSPATGKYKPTGLDQIRSVPRRRPRRPMKGATKCEKPAPAEDFLFKNILWAPAMGVTWTLTEPTGNEDRARIPRWRLAREGPFTNERSQASLRVLGKGCAFRHTTYSVEDHAPPEGGLGVPLNHPRFLEWVGAPASAWLLEMSPGQWCDTLSRDQAMTAAMQLHKDACLMNTDLDILDQYAFALHGTASKILEKTIGGSPYPEAEVAAEAQSPRTRRASVHMEALGLCQVYICKNPNGIGLLSSVIHRRL